MSPLPVDIILTFQEPDAEGIFPLRMDLRDQGFLTGKFTNPFLSAEQERWLVNIDRGVCSEFDLIQAGSILFQAVFNKKFYPLYQRALGSSHNSTPSHLRFQIKTNSPQILQLPWELLYDDQVSDGNGMFLSMWDWFELSIQTSTVGGSEVIQGAAELPMKLIVAWAQPKGMDDIYIERELRELNETFKPYIQNHKIELTIIEHATQNKLRTALKNPVDGFHFVGHIQQDFKGKSCLVVENDSGGAELLAPADLVGTLGMHVPAFVFLNSCRTDTTLSQDWSTALLFVAAGSSTVIANIPRVRSLHAVLFARSFYESWMVQPVESALSYARKTCLNELGVESQWYTSRLFLHEGVDKSCPVLSPATLSDSILEFLRTLDFCRVNRCESNPQNESPSTIRSTNQATFAPRALARLLIIDQAGLSAAEERMLDDKPEIIFPHCLSILRLAGFTFRLGESWAQGSAVQLHDKPLHSAVRLYRSRVRIWQGALTFQIEGTVEQIAAQELTIPYTGPQLSAGEYVWTLQVSAPFLDQNGIIEFRSLLLYSALRLLSPQEVTLYQDAVTGLAIVRPIEAAALLRGAAADLYGFYDEAVKAYQQASHSPVFSNLAQQLEQLIWKKRSQGILSPESRALLPKK